MPLRPASIALLQRRNPAAKLPTADHQLVSTEIKRRFSYLFCLFSSSWTNSTRKRKRSPAPRDWMPGFSRPLQGSHAESETMGNSLLLLSGRGRGGTGSLGPGWLLSAGRDFKFSDYRHRLHNNRIGSLSKKANPVTSALMDKANALFSDRPKQKLNTCSTAHGNTRTVRVVHVLGKVVFIPLRSPFRCGVESL